MSPPPDDQEFCLKWNNHMTTLLSVMDNLLEEESLVDVTLSADGQFIRAHRLVLSACSNYFRELFISSGVSDGHPVVILKDVEFENLKSLVEYMYKGEANVSQCKLSSFIQTAELLQIRGLAEGANKLKLEQMTQKHKLQLHQHLNYTNLTHPFSKVNLETTNTSSTKHHEDKGTNSILPKGHISLLDNLPFNMKNYHEQFANEMDKLGKTMPPLDMMPQKSTSINHLVQQVNHDALIKLESKNIYTLLSRNKNDNSDMLKIAKDNDGTTKCNDIYNMGDINDDGDNSEEELVIEDKGFINPWTGEDIRSMTGVTQTKFVSYDSPVLGLTKAGSENYAPDLNTYQCIRKEVKSPTDSDNGVPTNRLKRLTNTDSVYTLCQTQEGQKFQCVMCSRIFNLKCTLLRHVRHQHQGRFVPHPCKACGQVFKRSDHLKVHLKKIHNLVQDKSSLITA